MLHGCDMGKATMAQSDSTSEGAHDGELAQTGIDLLDFQQVIHDDIDEQEEDGSHTEYDPTVFHPSQVGYDEWLMLVNKLGLSDTSDLKGTFHTGTMIHEEIQGMLCRQTDIDYRDAIETEVEFTEDGLTFVGHADVYDSKSDIVYDIKSRANWYNFDPPTDRHLDQLHTYMRGLDAQYGQVIYVSKKDLEVRTWPEAAPFTFDDSRWDTIKQRCRRVRDAIIDGGYPTSEDEIPFEKPSGDHPQSYFAKSTTLDFSHFAGDAER